MSWLLQKKKKSTTSILVTVQMFNNQFFSLLSLHRLSYRLCRCILIRETVQGMNESHSYSDKMRDALRWTKERKIKMNQVLLVDYLFSIIDGFFPFSLCTTIFLLVWLRRLNIKKRIQLLSIRHVTCWMWNK